MSKYFDFFPKVLYDINKGDISEYQLLTNIMVRYGILREVISNASSYYTYTIKDGDKPEILADKAYGDPEAHWIILYANRIIDPQYDWPMDTMTFEKFIIDKYGSVEAAQTDIHHYEKIVERVNSNTTDVKKYVINRNRYFIISLSDANGSVSVSNTVVGQNSSANGVIVYSAGSNTYTVLGSGTAQFELNESVFITPANVSANIATTEDTVIASGEEDYYYDDVSATKTFQTYEVKDQNGNIIDTIEETVYRNAVTNYDYEQELNENRRNIRIIKKEYYTQIINEFKSIMNYSSLSNVRLIR